MTILNTISTGFYLVQESFKIDYGGAWSISLKQHSILQYDSIEKKLKSWDVSKQSWINRKPPISGVENMDFDRYGWDYEKKEQIQKFLKNTKKLNQKQAQDLISRQSINIDDVLKKANVMVIDGKINKSDVMKIIALVKGL